MAYYINSKRFILYVRLHFETVKNFCTAAKVSRNTFYKVLRKPYKTKNPPSFTRFFNLLNNSLEDGKYDYEFFWRKA